MKRLLTIFMALTALLSFSSCRRGWFNGDLDGFWRIDKITVTATGSEPDVRYPEDSFIMINLELLQLGTPNPAITGIISYSEKQKKLSVDFPYNPTPTALLRYGFVSNPANFDIVELNDKHLILKSESSEIVCTRF